MSHNQDSNKYSCNLSIAVLPLTQPVLLTTERKRRAEKLDVPENSLSIEYASFYSLCKAVVVEGDVLYIEPTLEEVERYSRIWGHPISRIRVVIETFFTFNPMPPRVNTWSEAINYLERDNWKDAESNRGVESDNISNALSILKKGEEYKVMSTSQRPYVDKDRKRRTSISRNSNSETILTHHIKQWASNWGPLTGYLTDNSLYNDSISPIDSVEYITRGKLPNASPMSYTTHDSFASSIPLSR